MLARAVVGAAVCLAVVEKAAAQALDEVPAASAEMRPAEPSLARATYDPEHFARILTRHGFANISSVADGGRVLVRFENTRYRDTRRALDEVAKLLRPALGQGRELVLVPLDRGIPLGTARYGITVPGSTKDSAAVRSSRRASLNLSDLPPAASWSRPAGSSFGRIDVVVHPWFEASFGDYDNPVRSRTGLAPEVRIAIRRGLSVSAQVLFTVQDDLPTGESTARPGLVTINQLARLPGNLFISATAGLFTPNRHGLDVQARAYSPEGRWFAGGELAVTGPTSFARSDWRVFQADERTTLVEAGWRDVRSGLSIQATAGAFRREQRGVRLDVVRQFGEVDLGGFVSTSGQGTNGGATLRIPLGTAKYPRPGPVRVRVADAFRWEYRYYGAVPTGRGFRSALPGDDVSRWLFNPGLGMR